MFDLFGQTRYQCPKCHTTFSYSVSVCPTCRTCFHGTRKVDKLAPDPREVRARQNREAAEAAAQKERERQNEIKTTRRAARECELCGKPLGFFARWLGKAAHGNCHEFTEPPSPQPPSAEPKPLTPVATESIATQPQPLPAPKPSASSSPKCRQCGSASLYADRYNICCRACGMKRDKGSYRW